MKAWLIRRYGGPEVLELGDLPRPEAGPRDVVVRVRAASVNPIDWKIREGQARLILHYAMPLVLGNDLAGEVTEVGEEVEGLAAGDRVYARPSKRRIGSFAEYLAVDAGEVAPMPRSTTFAEAASLPLVGLTSWQALVDLAGVSSGQRVFIPAGAGGVGTFAIQLAKHLGAEVATTASAPKHQLLRDLGADTVIDYRNEDFADVLEDCDVVLDTRGGEDLKRAFHVVKPGGAVVSIIGTPDPEFAREWGLPWYLKAGIWVAGGPTRRRARKRDVTYRFLFMHADGAELAEIARLVDAGSIRPVVDRVFPFEETNRAIAHAERGHATGKVVIEHRAPPPD